jgi:hypothetical protein
MSGGKCRAIVANSRITNASERIALLRGGADHTLAERHAKIRGYSSDRYSSNKVAGITASGYPNLVAASY